MNALKPSLRKVVRVTGQAVVGLVLLGLAWLAWRTHRSGHYWGDDFALYLRQAASLFGGTSVSDLIADNTYMLEHSYRSDFSPPVYPWGWPLVLAVPVRMVGLDVDRLKLVSLVLFVVMLLTLYVFSVGRVGVWRAVVEVLVIGTSPIYIDWTELLHSELPYMVFAFAGLIAIDRTRGRWATSWWSGLGAGVLAAAAFSVRREGLALLIAIGVAIVADGVLADQERRWRSLTPFAAFAAVVVLLQLVLPSTLVPRYPENTLMNVVRFGNTIARRIGEIFGFDSPTLGWAVVVLGLVGWVLALRSDWRRHAPAVAYLLPVMAVGGSFFIPSGRYFSTAVPLLILGLLMIPSLATDRRPVPGALVAVVVLVIGPFIWLNTGKALAEAERADRLSPLVNEGPYRPDAVEMFEAIKEETASDAVVGFFKARAMTLFTDRRSVQVGEPDPLNPGSQFDILVLRIDEVPEEDRADIDEDYEVTWSNETFELLTPKP